MIGDPRHLACTRTAAPLTVALMLLVSAPLAAQRLGPMGGPQPAVEFYTSGALSLRQTPLKTFYADVLSASLRAAVPVVKPVHAWLGGGIARVKAPCDSAAANCSSTDLRGLLGVAYEPGSALGGAYVGAGLGVSTFRGVQRLAHTFFIGVAIPTWRYVAPTIELRAEKYADLQELLMVSVGLRLAVPR